MDPILHAGGRKDVNKTVCIEAYMTMNMTSLLARPVELLLPVCSASHMYHSGDPEEIRVMIWTWDEVNTHTASII